MNKRFYLALNLILGLLMAIGLFQSLIQFLIGQEVFKLKAYFLLFWTSEVVSVFMSVLLLKYYWSRKYWLAFSTAVAMTLMLAVLSWVFYMTMVSKTMQVYFLPSLLTFHGIALIYSSCLVFSASGKRFWLRASGIFMYLISACSIILILFASYINSPDFYAQIDKIFIWLSVASNLVPILFIINFNAEIRQLKETDTEAPSWKFSTIVLYVLVALSFVAVANFGAMLGNDVYHSRAYDVKSSIQNIQPHGDRTPDM